MTDPALPQVDFYLTGATDGEARLALVCRLAEKAYRQGLKVFIRTADGAQAKAMDRWLWTFRDGSFVPHALLPLAQDDPSTVVLGPGPGPGAEVLIRLDDDEAVQLDGYGRVLEVLDGSERVRALGRARFKAYKAAGVTPATHEI